MLRKVATTSKDEGAPAGSGNTVTEEQIATMSVKDLKAFIISRGGSVEGLLEKAELRAAALRLLKEETTTSEEPSLEVETSTPMTPQQALQRELQNVPAPRIAAFLNEKLTQLSHGMSLGDLPPIPTKICGKIFQEGDLAYNCRTCETDGTCVQCQECFNESNHDGHEVLFHRAGAGGCCDCGDLEAWAEEGCCSQHGPNSKATTDPLESLPSEMAEAARVVFGGCVLFLNRLARQEALSFCQALPSSRVQPGSPENKRGDYYLLVHNDDVHTYDEVIDAFTHSSLNSIRDPREATNAVDKMGRCPVHRESSLFKAQEAASVFSGQRRIADPRKGGLLLSVAPAAQLELEKGGVAIVAWLRKVCEASAGLMRMLLLELTNPDELDTRQLAQTWLRENFRWQQRADEFGAGSVLDTLVRVHALLPKLLVKQLSELFLRMIVDEQFRAELGLALGKSLPLLARAYAHGLGVQDDTLLHLNVQVFTVRSIAVEYQVRFGSSLLQQAMLACTEFLQVACSNGFAVDLGHPSILHRRYRLFFQCVRYQLQIGVLKQMPTQMAEAAFETFAKRVLTLLNFMDEHRKRQQLDHVLYERESWAYAFNLSVDAFDLIDSATEALTEVGPVAQRVLALVVAQASRDPDYQNLIALGRLPVSFHLPLHRLAALLCRRMVERGDIEGLFPQDPSLFLKTSVAAPIDFIDKPLRIIVASSQIALGMWRRDGTVPYNEMIYYTSGGKLSFFDLDVETLQMACCALMTQLGPSDGASRFFTTVLTRFAVFSWMLRAQMVATEIDGLTANTQPLLGLSEATLQVLIRTVSGLPKPSKEPMTGYVRRGVVHSLAKAPSGGIPFSDVLVDLERDGLVNGDDDGDGRSSVTQEQVAEILTQCAKVTETIEGERKFELRPELFVSEFDAFNWQLTRMDQEHATEKRERQIAADAPRHPVPLCPAPLPISSALHPVLSAFTGSFLIGAIVRAVLCDAVGANPVLRERGVKTVSHRLEKESGMESVTLEPVTWSEDEQQIRLSRTSPGLVRAALHLLTLALHNRQFMTVDSLLQRTSGLESAEATKVEFHRFSVLECIRALLSVANLKDAEGLGLEWILQEILNNFVDSGGYIQLFTADVRSERAAEQTNSEAKEGKKASKKRRAISAQQAMMDRIRSAQQAAVKSLLREEEESGEGAGRVSDDADRATEDEEEEQLICSLCREQGEVNDLGFFAYSHVSCWERNSEEPSPIILARGGRPAIGWIRPAGSTVAVSSSSSSSAALDPAAIVAQGASTIPPSTSAAVGGSDSNAALDWSMADVQELASGLVGSGAVQGPFDDDEDDDDDMEEDDEMDEDMDEDDGEEGFFADEAGFEMVGEEEDLPPPAIMADAAETNATEAASSFSTSYAGFADRFAVRTSHGMCPPHVHVRCCPHAVHFRCLEEYQRHAHSDRNELTKFQEFQCSVCKSVSNTLMFTGGERSRALKTDPSKDVRSWENIIDDSREPLVPPEIFEQAADDSNDFYKRTIHKIVGKTEALDSLDKAVFALGAIPFSLSIKVDSLTRVSESTPVEEVLRDALKSRRESYAMFQTLSRGALALMALGESSNQLQKHENGVLVANQLVELLRTGVSPSSDLLRRVTANVRHVTVNECDDNTRLVVPAQYLQQQTAPITADLQDLGVQVRYFPAEKSLVVTNSLSPSVVAIGMRLTTVDGESIDGREFGNVKLTGNHAYTFASPSSSRPCFLLDFDPLVLFCLLCSLSWRSLSATKLQRFLRLTLAICMTRAVLAMIPATLLQPQRKVSSASSSSAFPVLSSAQRGNNSEFEDPKDEEGKSLVAMEALVRHCLGASLEEAQDGERTRTRLRQDVAAFLTQVSAFFGTFLGQRWVDKALQTCGSCSTNDVDRLWEIFDLPRPAPFEWTSMRGSALETMIAPWIAHLQTSRTALRGLDALYRPVKQSPLSLHFVPLPIRYDELYSKLMTQAICGTRGVSPPKEPALCLLCGDVVCAGATCCKRKDLSLATPNSLNPLFQAEWQGVGLATLHARACGDGLGAFLFIQRAQVLLVNGGRAVFVPAPYVDAYGDTDPNLRRGRPLSLNAERYEAMQRMIAEHRLANEVVRTRNSASQILYVDYF